MNYLFQADLHGSGAGGMNSHMGRAGIHPPFYSKENDPSAQPLTQHVLITTRTSPVHSPQLLMMVLSSGRVLHEPVCVGYAEADVRKRRVCGGVLQMR